MAVDVLASAGIRVRASSSGGGALAEAAVRVGKERRRHTASEVILSHAYD
jgi:hypothetical protein